MNPTIITFGYPDSLVKEYEHWVALVRADQVTLGSLVLAAKGDATAFGALEPAAFAELGEIVPAIERALRALCGYEKINYLMLMMVDPNVHLHVLPRYSGTRRWGDVDFPDAGWPKAPQLGNAVALLPEQVRDMAAELSLNFR
jgi:diadenosine tetraphosphate (Ap4A) HIT family hydrolase